MNFNQQMYVQFMLKEAHVIRYVHLVGCCIFFLGKFEKASVLQHIFFFDSYMQTN